MQPNLMEKLLVVSALAAVVGTTLLSAQGGHAIYEPYHVATVAGCGNNIGSTDGPPDQARFFNPVGAAVDKQGNVYVVEEGNHAVRKITPDGVISTFAGVADEYGSADGQGSEARFHSPGGIVVGSDGYIYVADTYNSTIRVISRNAVVRTLAGLAGVAGFVDGNRSAARFFYPRGITVNKAGKIFVADELNSSIREVTPGGAVTTFAGNGIWGWRDGTGTDAQFAHPYDVAADKLGNLFVADTENAMIRKITPDAVVTTYKYLGYLVWPNAVEVDRDFNVVEADSYHINKIAPDGEITLLAGGGYGSADGTGPEAKFIGIYDLGRDRFGNFFVPDKYNNTIRKVTAEGVVTTFCGIAQIGSRDGIGTEARFFNPVGMTRDASGAIYIADSSNSTIRKMTANGTVTTFAGKAQEPGYVDGHDGEARFNAPQHLASDSLGNIYVADAGNGVVRKITPDADVTTVANGYYFNGLTAVALDPTGDIYVSGDFSISKIAPDGTVTLFAGAPGDSGFRDGQGGDARFDYPTGIISDAAGNLFVADFENNAIRKITPTAEVTTFAGRKIAGSDDGVGLRARFHYPLGISIDSAGNLYVTDYGNQTLRKITPGASTTTLAGEAEHGGWVDATGKNARLLYPHGIVSDPDGDLYFADTGSQIIRRAVPAQ